MGVAIGLHVGLHVLCQVSNFYSAILIAAVYYMLNYNRGQPVPNFINMSFFILFLREKVYFRSQILERPSIGKYWNIFGVPVLPENVIFTFFRTCWCYS